MMNKQITCTALAMMFVMCTIAQGFGEIHGKVLDENGESVVGAFAVASNGGDQVGTATDVDGGYRIKPLKAGSYDVSFYMVGYDTLIMKGVSVTAEKTTFMEDAIMAASDGLIGGPPVVIYFVPKHLDPTGGTINTIGAKELEHNAAICGGNINQLLISMTPEIKSSPNGEELYFRGSRAGSVIYFIDGVKYTGNNVKIPASGINSVSVYTGGLPANYGDTTGGVVVIETKNYLQEYYRMLNQ